MFSSETDATSGIRVVELIWFDPQLLFEALFVDFGR